MKKKIKYLLILALACACFIFIDNVYAVGNTGPFNGLNISQSGNFIRHTSNGNLSLGYNMSFTSASGSDALDSTSYYYATPSSANNLVYADKGISLLQCDMSFLKGNYYAVSYYFLSDSFSYYYHPSYSNSVNKLAIGTSINLSVPNFAYEEVSNDRQFKLIDNIGYLQSYTVVFKANDTGTCLLSTFNSNPSGSALSIQYVGYDYKHLGTTSLSASDISNALSSSFNDVSSKIDNYTQETNARLDELNSKQAEQNETSKGIWQSLKDGISSIGNWFKSLGESLSKGFSDMLSSLSSGFQYVIDGLSSGFSDMLNALSRGIQDVIDGFVDGISSIGEFFASLGEFIGGWFSDLWKGIKSLFVGEEVTTCTTYTNYFNGFSKLYSNYFQGLRDNDIRLNSDGTFSWDSRNGYNSYLMPNYDFKPNTTYRIFLEVTKVGSGTSTPSANDSIQYHFGSIYANDGNYNLQYNSPSSIITFTSVGIYSLDFTTSSNVEDTDFAMALHVTYSSNVKYSSVTRILITDDLSMTVDNYEYFTGTKEKCETDGTSGGLFGMITNFTNSVGQWFKDLLGGILDGIKGLFVPTDDQLYEIVNDSKDLTENFGFVGESLNFILTIFTSLLGLVNANGCIELPEFSIGETTLFPSHKFWDAQNVCLADNVILSSNISTIRSFTSIILVCMFIGFGASKFFTILSKNDYANDSSGVDVLYDASKDETTISTYERRGTSTSRTRRKFRGGF